MEDFSIKVRESARKHNMCDKVYDAWQDDYTKQDMINIWKANFDFAIKEDYPTNKFIRKHFDEALLHKNGIYVDEMVNTQIENGMYIFQGECTGIAKQKDIRFSNIYVRHNCKMTFIIGFMGDAHITVFDDADVTIRLEVGAKCTVYKHGGKVTAPEGVTVRER